MASPAEHYQTSRGHADRYVVVEVDDSQDIQYHKIESFKDEKFSKVAMVFPHGFTSHAPKDSNLWGFAQGGARDRLLIIGGEHPDKRPKSTPQGGAALYDANGKIIKLFPDENVWDAGGKKLTIMNASEIAIGVNGTWIRIRPGRIDLGVASADAQATPAVVTTAGPSTKVFAVV